MLFFPASIIRMLTALTCALTMTACSSVNSMLGGSSEDDALKALKWTYAEDGIQIVSTADPHLNQSVGEPHTLALSVVQMDDPSAFASYASNAGKMSALLLANSAPPEFLSLNRIFISPGESRTLTLARMENAKYVGVVAGYYHLDPTRSARLYRIGVEVGSSGFIVKSRNASPEPLRIELSFGADALLESVGTKVPPVKIERPVGGPVPSAVGAPTNKSN